MAKDLSIAKQILGILEDAGKPLFLSEIRQALGGDYEAHYIQPSIINLIKSGSIKSGVKTVPAIKGEKKLKVYFIDEENDPC